MNPMSTFDPDKPCKVHDLLNDSTFEWKAGWANHWRTYAFEQGDGTVSWDGLTLDGWTAS
jgi:hypothetical protein